MKLDAKLGFYLKHRDQIDEWAELVELGRVAADKFFRSLAPAMAPLAKRLGEVEPFVSFAKGYGKLFLHRSGWREPGAEWPRIAIGLEWQCSKVRFDRAWGGVWVQAEMDEDGRLARAVESELRKGPDVASGFERPEKWWPLWRYEAPEDAEFWNDLDAFGRQLVSAMEGYWVRFSPVVERAVACAP